MTVTPHRATTHQRKRKKLTGKGGGYSFIGLPHYILKSPEFAALTPNAVKLLIELAKEYKGENNGDFSAAYSVLKTRGWRSPGTLSKALKELLEKGWIVTTRHGGRHRCSLYAVTWWPINGCGGKLELAAENVARHDWKKTQNVVAIRPDAVATRTEEGSETT
jgi:hypothetical protein